MTTRERLLAERSLEPVVRDESGRTIPALWRDAHTGFESSDPSDFDIDHRVPFQRDRGPVPADVWVDEVRSNWPSITILTTFRFDPR